MRIGKLELLTLVLCLAGCTAKPDGETLALAYPSAGAIMNTHLGLILEKTEILKKHGFAPQISSMGTGKELKVALVSGRADVILTTETNFPVLLGEGFDAVGINSLGSAGRLGLLVRDEKLKNLGDLKGKSIATIFGTSVHQPAVVWAKEAGATLMNMGSVAAMQAALEAGQVAGIVTWDPYLTDALENGGRLLKEDRFDLIAVASRQFVKRGLTAKLNAALTEAVEYLREHRQEVNQDFAKLTKIKAATIHKASLANKNYAMDAGPVEISIEQDFRRRLQAAADFLLSEKIIRGKADIGAHVWTN